MPLGMEYEAGCLGYADVQVQYFIINQSRS